MLLLGVIAIILWIYYLWSQRRYYYLTWKTNGMFGYPIIGLALKLKSREKIMETIEATIKTRKRAVMWFGPVPYLYVTCPKTCEIIFKSNTITNKADFYDVIGDNFGNGLFSIKEPEWSHHRRLIHPAFRLSILQSFVPIFNEQTDILMESIKNYVNKGEVNIQKIVKLCALDTACATTMGKKMNFQKAGSLDILQAYREVSRCSISRISKPWYHPQWVFKHTSLFKKLTISRQPIRNFIRGIIQEKIDESESKLTNNNNNNNISKENDDIVKEKNIFVDQILNNYRTQGFTFDDLENETNTIIVAAYHTTANTINQTLMCLAMFPEYQEKVFNELASLLPDQNTEITYNHVEQMKYLEQSMNETMRVFAPIPIIGRKCSEDFKLSDGLTVPKNTQIVIDVFRMHRDEDVWGDTAKQFNPERFSRENIKNIHPYAFMPFSKGVRNCVGYKYAILFVKLTLAKILRKYQLKTTFKYEEIECMVDVSIQFKRSPMLQLIERNE